MVGVNALQTLLWAKALSNRHADPMLQTVLTRSVGCRGMSGPVHAQLGVSVPEFIVKAGSRQAQWYLDQAASRNGEGCA